MFLTQTTSASDVTAVSKDGGVLCADRGLVSGEMYDMQLEYKHSRHAGKPTGRINVACDILTRYFTFNAREYV